MRTQTHAPNKDEPDTLEFIMAFEQGDLTEPEVIAGMQSLIDSGLAWSLQGSYGRLAEDLIKAGLCTRHLNS